MNYIRRSKFEIALLAIIIGMVVTFSIGLYAGRAKLYKERLLTIELSTIRSSINLYSMLNKNIPSSFEELLQGTYDFGDGIKHRYSDIMPKTSDGRLVDPFGNDYLYDAERGWAYSGTTGYGSW